MEEKYSEKLHNVMNLTGWKQNKVAEELGVSEAHVSRLLKGSHEPSPQLAKLINYMVAEAGEKYSVTTVHRALSAEDEGLLSALDHDEEMKEALKKFMQLKDPQLRNILLGKVEELVLLNQLNRKN